MGEPTREARARDDAAPSTADDRAHREGGRETMGASPTNGTSPRGRDARKTTRWLDGKENDARGIALDAVRDARGEEGKLAEQGVRGVRQTVHVEEKVGKLLGRSDDVLEVVQR